MAITCWLTMTRLHQRSLPARIVALVQNPLGSPQTMCSCFRLQSQICLSRFNRDGFTSSNHSTWVRGTFRYPRLDCWLRSWRRLLSRKRKYTCATYAEESAMIIGCIGIRMWVAGKRRLEWRGLESISSFIAVEFLWIVALYWVLDMVFFDLSQCNRSGTNFSECGALQREHIDSFELKPWRWSNQRYSILLENSQKILIRGMEAWDGVGRKVAGQGGAARAVQVLDHVSNQLLHQPVLCTSVTRTRRLWVRENIKKKRARAYTYRNAPFSGKHAQNQTRCRVQYS